MRKCPNRHRNCWIIAGGYWLWCYECGAVRQNATKGTWTYPTGPGGRNPALDEVKG